MTTATPEAKLLLDLVKSHVKTAALVNGRIDGLEECFDLLVARIEWLEEHVIRLESSVEAPAEPSAPEVTS